MSVDPKLTVTLSAEDLFDIACLCHASLAQDSPYSEKEYLNRILNMVWAYLPKHYKSKVEVYLAEKEYLPPAPKIEIAK